MKDRKRGFWILVIVFGLLIIAGLGLDYEKTGLGAEGMGLSMGGMMKMHHTDNLAPTDLLKQVIENHNMGDTSGHHKLSPLMETLAFLTTITVFTLVPLLIGSTVALLILWL